MTRVHLMNRSRPLVYPTDQAVGHGYPNKRGDVLLRVLFPILVLTLAAGCSARAPARSLIDLQQRILPGHTLDFIDAAATETRGKVTAITPSGLTLIDASGLSKAFNEPQIREVQRYGDSLWNGALIGAGSVAPFVVLGGLMTAGDPTCTGECRLTAADSVIPIGLAGAIGAGIDWLRRGRQQVFLASGQKSTTRDLHVAPLLYHRGGGVA